MSLDAILGGLSIGSSVASGVLGNQAANTQSDAAINASTQANALQKYIYDNNQKIAQPWLQQGGSAVNRLGFLLGLPQSQPQAAAPQPQGGTSTGGGQVGDYFPPNNPSQFNAFNDPFFSSSGYFTGTPSSGNASPWSNAINGGGGGGQFGKDGSSGYGYPGQLLAPDGNSPYNNFSSDANGPGSFDGNGYANTHPGNIGGKSWDAGLGGGLGDGNPLGQIFGAGSQGGKSAPAASAPQESFQNFSNAATASGMLPLHSYQFSAQNPAASEQFGSPDSNYDTGPHGRVSGGAGLYAQYPGDPTPSRLQSYQNGNGLSNYLLAAPVNSGSVALREAPPPMQREVTPTAPATAPVGAPPIATSPTTQSDSPYGTAGEFGSLNKDFGLADFQTDPGYQFRIQQGQKALESSAASRGSLFSGGTLKALDEYNQNFASNEFGNAYNRFQINRTNKINPLLSLAGLGQQSAQQMQASGSNYANQAGANTIAGLTGAANAQASGYASTANAINNGTNGISNLLMLRNLGLG